MLTNKGFNSNLFHDLYEKTKEKPAESFIIEFIDGFKQWNDACLKNMNLKNMTHFNEAFYFFPKFIAIYAAEKFHAFVKRYHEFQHNNTKESYDKMKIIVA
jgi:hypothetical protein